MKKTLDKLKYICMLRAIKNGKEIFLFERSLKDKKKTSCMLQHARGVKRKSHENFFALQPKTINQESKAKNHENNRNKKSP